jgi:UDP-glucose 4-epimerase
VRALVTGGAGFIGSTLVDALLAAGHDVVVLDDLSTGRRENLTHDAPLETVDVADAPAVGALLERVRPEVVFHLAAQIDVRRAVADPALDARVNVAGTAAVLEAARAAGARRVVLASTGGALYGEAATIPTVEDSPLAPLSPYGASKAAAETYLALYGRLHGLSTLALRLANVYGPRQDPRGEAGVVARFCGAKLEGSSATVFGDGRQTRDYVDVGDVVGAFLSAADSDVTGAVNVGTGRETSVLDLLAALDLEARHEPPRPGEVARSALDATAAARALGWEARTPLADGLARTLSWAAAARTG